MIENSNVICNDCGFGKQNKELAERLKKTQELELEVRKENTKLKELLKECKRYIDIWGYTDTHGNLLFPQIEQALGENK